MVRHAVANRFWVVSIVLDLIVAFFFFVGSYCWWLNVLSLKKLLQNHFSYENFDIKSGVSICSRSVADITVS